MKGITLIALVITIVVLLILAGVSINAITGNENVMEKAKEAKTATENANELDSIKLAVVDAVAKGIDKKVSKDKLAEALEGLIEGDIAGGDTNPWTVRGKITGNIYTITENGNVTDISAMARKINELIGADVEGYTTDSDEETGGWRVYYASAENKEVFLISTKVVPSEKVFGANNGIPLKEEYLDSNDVFNPKTAEAESGYTYKNVTYGEKYNLKWKTQLKETTNTIENSKATAYLCDPKNWTEYILPTAPKGTYAVGGPTKELLALSWEATGHKAKWSDNINEDVVAVGYMWNKPAGLHDKNPILRTILPKTSGEEDGLYNTGISYWLASLSGNFNDHVCYVDSGGYVSHSVYNAKYGVHPLVSIPISNVQIEGNTVKIVP